MAHGRIERFWRKKLLRNFRGEIFFLKPNVLVCFYHAYLSDGKFCVMTKVYFLGAWLVCTGLSEEITFIYNSYRIKIWDIVVHWPLKSCVCFCCLQYSIKSPTLLPYSIRVLGSSSWEQSTFIVDRLCQSISIMHLWFCLHCFKFFYCINVCHRLFSKLMRRTSKTKLDLQCKVLGVSFIVLHSR